ncbi:proton-translocating transhydrogenase family protein [Roseibium limicola]|uniref:proton-translocating NAD(P)(+) transhydrogenase n=1 Tax=Roseibium limicola TaxID=2816037 RepID=A0A939ES69_9HYPH|nr:proton-translocating transhydrogenase family protein [Roseibium limicola]MBO0346951.1 NAD(P) transhydrogenase subunit alpha [Roseibium limicola]
MSDVTQQADALERAQAAVQAAGEAAEGAREASAAAASYLDQLAGLATQATGATGGVDPFVFLFSVFIMAIFVGYYVVWSVTPALHTPLMAVTNAISSVIIVGALLAVGVDLASGDGAIWAKIFGFIALVLASVNIFGGFMVTSRMLAMYKKKQR